MFTDVEAIATAARFDGPARYPVPTHPGFELWMDGPVARPRLTVVCGGAYRRLATRPNTLLAAEDHAYEASLSGRLDFEIDRAIDKLWARWEAL